MKDKIVAFDPGTVNTGYAVWELTDRWRLTVASIIRPSATKPAPKRIKFILNMAEEILPGASEIYVEQFTPYGARKGMEWNMYLVGALMNLGRPLDIPGYGVVASTWKAWRKREKPRIPKLPENDHARDAAYIGWWGLKVGRKERE